MVAAQISFNPLKLSRYICYKPNNSVSCKPTWLVANYLHINNSGISYDWSFFVWLVSILRYSNMVCWKIYYSESFSSMIFPANLHFDPDVPACQCLENRGSTYFGGQLSLFYGYNHGEITPISWEKKNVSSVASPLTRTSKYPYNS